MCDVVVCFNGFKDKNYLRHLCDLVHLMGGSIRAGMEDSVTHMVTNTVFGEKYQAAVMSLDTLIMKEKWIHACWEKRMDIGSGKVFKLMPVLMKLLIKWTESYWMHWLLLVKDN